MIELAVKTFVDMGLERKRALVFVAVLGFLLGIPSAISMTFFENQDFVWGIALMISGGFISFAIIKHGADSFRQKAVNGEGSDVQIGRWYNVVITWIIPLQVVVLIGWWFYLSISSFDTEGWWNPLNTYSVGTCLMQWGVIMTVFILLNKLMVRRTLRTGTGA